MPNNLDRAGMSEPRFHIIGISDSHRQYLTPDAENVISVGSVFSGGRRHHELMASRLPDGYEWIEVSVPLQAVYDRYRGKGDVVVFASGDPLFYGYAATLRREFPDSEITVYPSFNSLQMLAHRLLLPYQDMVNVSLTGRPWSNLDSSVIEGRPLIGVLTDKVRTPAAIATRLLEYGYDNYEMTVGENLGNEERERLTTLSLPEAAGTDFGCPNCLILRRMAHRKRFFGIPEDEFHHLEGREKMITKMPARLLTLSMLELDSRKSLWDIGFCTGSVSIEARLQYPSIDITSFEIREEGRELMAKNSRRFGALSINAVIGDFMSLDLSSFPRPDAVFIGGHGGRLEEMIVRIGDYIMPGGVIVFNSVSAESCETFRAAVRRIGLHVTLSRRLTIDSHNPLTIMQAR